MSTCPKCHEEVEPGFEVCWNCNYSFTEEQIIRFKEMGPDGKEIDCLRCQEKMVYSGFLRINDGTYFGVSLSLFQVLSTCDSFELYACPKCGKVEFFT